MSQAARPFLKWAGGKGKMMRHILPRLPSEIGKYGEFMVGAGAVFIELARLKRFRHATISDSNKELMLTWRVVRDGVDGLVDELRSPKYVYGRSQYLLVRDLDPSLMSDVEVAARFIYLNRTCFNGLYRVNLAGRFNVPFGRYSNPLICDEPNLRAVSALLVDVDIKVADAVAELKAFRSARRSGPVNAVYIDPPYIPLSKTAKFVNYTVDGFSMDSHVSLVSAMTDLAQSGTRVVTSNSCAPAAGLLLKDFDVDYVVGSRSVAGGGTDRKSVREIVAFAGPRL